MNCNCMDEIKSKVKNDLSAKNPEYADKRIIGATFENAALIFLDDGKCSTQLVAPMTIEYEQKNKKGEIKFKKKTVNFTFKFCPFCGKEYEK